MLFSSHIQNEGNNIRKHESLQTCENKSKNLKPHNIIERLGIITADVVPLVCS